MDHAAAMVPSPSGYQPERRTGSSARRRRVAGRRVPLRVCCRRLPRPHSSCRFRGLRHPSARGDGLDPVPPSARRRAWVAGSSTSSGAQEKSLAAPMTLERAERRSAFAISRTLASTRRARMGVAPGFRIVTAGPRRGAGRGLPLRRRRAAERGGVAPGRPAPPASGLRSARRWSPAARAGPGWSSAARAAEAPGRRGRSGRAPWRG